MDQVRFAKGLQPTVVEVAGCACRLFFSLRAAIAIEARFEKPYLDVVLDIIQAPDDAGKRRPPMQPEDQADVICILMAEAGQNVEKEDLLALHMTDFSALCRAAQAEILLKMPEGSKKNGNRNRMGLAPGYQRRSESPGTLPRGTPWVGSVGSSRAPGGGVRNGRSAGSKGQVRR